MKTPVLLEKYRSEIESEIKSVIDSRSCPLYKMMRYHLGWMDRKGNPVQGNSGKVMRPALCLFSCEAAGGIYRQALPAAAALELVHNFSLIHDDIQDNDRERRHRPTVWALWGKAQAINAGTAMRILANTALLRLGRHGVPLEKQAELQALLDETSLRLIEGQYLDIEFENRYDISQAEYLTMIGGKTASLISVSMKMGASLGTECEDTIAGLSEAGWQLGLAFQIRDDILGIWGSSNETGKPAGSDILRRKKSFPMVFALENSRDGTKEELISIYKNRLMDEETVRRVLEIFESVDTREHAREMVDRYCASASGILDSLELSPVSRAGIDELVRFLASREY
ncbi:MAG: polyprenyl synthetase family protein [Dehalococcoidales bacterium]|nr:polyprenyl synthetase family protein [Dehalococcoidales bacterium]